MKRLATLALLLVGAAADARQTTPAPFVAGKPLGTVVDGATVPLSRNVRVYGGMVNAESCSFDPSRNLIVVPSRGAAQDEVPNDGSSRCSIPTARCIPPGGSAPRATV